MGDKRATRNSHGAEDTSEGNDLAGVARNLLRSSCVVREGREKELVLPLPWALSLFLAPFSFHLPLRRSPAPFFVLSSLFWVSLPIPT